MESIVGAVVIWGWGLLCGVALAGSGSRDAPTRLGRVGFWLAGGLLGLLSWPALVILTYEINGRAELFLGWQWVWLAIPLLVFLAGRQLHERGSAPALP